MLHLEIAFNTSKAGLTYVDDWIMLNNVTCFTRKPSSCKALSRCKRTSKPLPAIVTAVYSFT